MMLEPENAGADFGGPSIAWIGKPKEHFQCQETTDRSRILCAKFGNPPMMADEDIGVLPPSRLVRFSPFESAHGPLTFISQTNQKTVQLSLYDIIPSYLLSWG